MKLSRLTSLLILLLIVLSCSTSSILDRPEYKPMDRENEKATNLWENSEQYYLASILQYSGSVELSFGNNGTVKPNSYFSKNFYSNYGLSMVLEVVNKSDKIYKINLSNTFIKDKNGKVWKLSNCEKIVENNRMTSTVNIKPVQNNSPQSSQYTNNLAQEYSTNGILQVESNTTSNFFLIFGSEYQTPDNLPSIFTFNIQTEFNGSTLNNRYKFDKIDW